jgi:hypothetical protein
MGSIEKFPARYTDPEYQASHRQLFSGVLLSPLEDVLPPGLNQQQFDAACADFEAAVGRAHVFRGQSLEEYVDPYELWEQEGKRKMPSAAVV